MPDNSPRTCSAISLIETTPNDNSPSGSLQHLQQNQGLNHSPDVFADSPLSKMKSMLLRRAQSTPPEFSKDDTLRSRQRGKSLGVSSVLTSGADLDEDYLRRQRSLYFEKEFSSRDPRASAKQRVAKDSVITLAIRLNHFATEAEHLFHYDLSFALSEIYQRPASCIMVMVNSDFSILLHGTTEPAYHLTITALPSDIAATKNKRSAYLIQQFLYDSLGILPSRGVIKFETVSEENLATNGHTALQEIEALVRNSTDEARPVLDGRKRTQKHKEFSSMSQADASQGIEPNRPAVMPYFFRKSSRVTSEATSTNEKAPVNDRMKRRVKIRSLFGI